MGIKLDKARGIFLDCAVGMLILPTYRVLICCPFGMCEWDITGMSSGIELSMRVGLGLTSNFFKKQQLRSIILPDPLTLIWY